MNSLLVGGLLVAIYLVINLLLPLAPVGALLKTYLFQPIIWGLFILAVRYFPPYRALAKQYLRNTFLQIALGIGILQIALLLIGGLFTGFGKNPSSLTPLGIVENLLFVGTVLVGMELGRAWLITRLGRRHTFLALILVTLLFTILSIPLSQLRDFPMRIQSIELVVSSWVPLLAENLIASQLSLLGGARVSLAYRALLAAFWWFCPVLPDLSWALKGLIGAGVPILGMIVVSSVYSAQANRGKSKRFSRQTSFPTGWVVTALASVLIVWFAVGIFPFQPSVVPTGSMIPVIYPGDVVIVAKTQDPNIKLGDIVEYRSASENINIVHRVIEIDGQGDQRAFITKGDNNSSPDPDPVPVKNVIGKVIFNIPKVGWISLVLKSLLTGG